MTNSFQQKRTIYFRYPSDKAYTFIEGDGDEQFAYRAFEDDYTNRIFGHKTPYKNLKLDVQEGSHPSSMSREDYSNAFKRIEQQFANGSLEKIILSRVIKSKSTQRISNRYLKDYVSYIQMHLFISVILGRKEYGVVPLLKDCFRTKIISLLQSHLLELRQRLIHRHGPTKKE